MRIPQLGPRGVGWVAGQVVLLTGIGASGIGQLLRPTSTDGERLLAAALGIGAIVVGGGVAVRGIRDLGSSLTPFPGPSHANQLVETGIYRLVRHPIYSGITLASLGWGVATLAPLAIGLAMVLLIWFDLKSRVEERWLLARHPDYLRYRARTRRFIPRVY